MSFSIEEIKPRFDSLLLKARERAADAAAVAEALSGLPRPACRFHPNERRQLDAQRTAREWADRTQDPTPRWKRCPRCEYEADVLLPRWQFWRARGVPRSYFNCRLDELDLDERTADELDAYAQKPLGFLLLLGPPGTGKTHSALAMLQRQRTGLYLTQSELVAVHRRGYGQRNAEDIRGIAMHTDFLVLDEILRASGGNDATTLLFDVVNARYSDGLPTVVCGNATKDELRPKLGDALADRLNGGLSALIELTGKSSRGRASDGWADRIELVKRLEAIEAKIREREGVGI